MFGVKRARIGTRGSVRYFGKSVLTRPLWGLSLCQFCQCRKAITTAELGTWNLERALEYCLRKHLLPFRLSQVLLA